MASGFQDAIVPQVAVKVATTSAAAIYSVAQLVYGFTIQSKAGNTGTVYVGASNIDSTASISLAASGTFTAPVIYAGGSNPMQYDLSEWYIRASAASQEVAILKIRKAQNI